MSGLGFGVRLHDERLAAFHGGREKCTITIHADGTVTTSGDCTGVTVRDD